GSEPPPPAAVERAPITTPFTRPAPVPAANVSTPSAQSIMEKRLSLEELAKWLKPGGETWAISSERASYLAQAKDGVWTIAEVAADGPELGRMLDEKKLRLRGFDLKDFAKRHFMSRLEVDWDQMLAAYVARASQIESVAPLFTLYNGESLPEL